MALKNEILCELETNRQSALSGQTLANRFGVSRNAIWKAVNTLKAEGFAIDSAPNRGYQLSPACDRLSAERIRALLGRADAPIYCFDTLTSTNNEAKRRLANGEAGPFIVAGEEQTAGRGRQGRIFYSPKGTGLYMTVALPAGQTPEGALGITAYAAVCVTDAIHRLIGQEAQIKWVNDLFLDGRKICGILTEAVTDFESGTLISLLVGVGLNLRYAEMPSSIEESVGFLNCGAPVKNQLAADIAAGLLRFSPADRSYLEMYRNHSMTLGHNVLWAQGGQQITGKAVALGEDGALIVQGEDGLRHALRSGEIQILPD
ncbi:MAG: biotin--[acetyl-CoA-carboxylase] ligase [Eubacteriales bacterium]|nr:biotin--[acetyl-CoA-carboxylase] ligase [Eubacteriales bacterium]